MATDIYALVNPGFENGSTGWTLPGSVTVVPYTNPPEGTHAARFSGTGGVTDIINTKVAVAPAKRITASAMYQQGAASAGRNKGNVMLFWYDSSDNKVGESPGNVVSSGSNGRWNKSTVVATPPTGATKVAIGARVIRDNNSDSWFDAFTWDHSFTSEAAITSPGNGTTYKEGDVVPFRVSIDNGTLTPVKVDWKANATSIGEVSETPFSLNYSELTDGIYDITADITMSDGTVITAGPVLLNISDVAPPPVDTREFKASNSYTRLIMSKLNNVDREIPSISIVTGCRLSITYSLAVLSRTLDKDIPPDGADPDMAFSILNDGVIEATLLNNNGSSGYSIIGGTEVGSIPLDRGQFTREEFGTSGEFAWNVFTSDKTTLELGGEDGLFGLTDISLAEFLDASIALRFYPTLSGIPVTSDKGEVCVRIFIDTVKAEVYFDAGSVEYYFANMDTGHTVKGTLVASNVLEGNLRSGDAAGYMQLAPQLENMDSPNGEDEFVYQGYTIHSYYPPTESNYIGDVEGDMEYNGLPMMYELEQARTKAKFITANFYGDERMDAMFGVNGVGRAYSYNGEYFYKIFTQPEAALDKPRHVAYHHAHLALGYKEGRVDVSVVGQPWNFSGVEGASSWGIGDSVTGMIALSGTVLGIFCDNSVVGLNGTTVDNFATQVISPRMGALEYTVVDMGYPVYANSYGIYTLSQTQQYGDFLGMPLSQDVSPWIRPRLTTDPKAAACVNMAYPVRSKNQYRLSFTDGNILTMTMNYGQQSAPTFSIHSYNMVPTAVSSQLDLYGREKLHMTASLPTPPIPPAECAVIKLSDWSYDENQDIELSVESISNAPEWLEQSYFSSIYIDFFDNGTEIEFERASTGVYIPVSPPPSNATGRGTIRGPHEEAAYVCVQWETPVVLAEGLKWSRESILYPLNGGAVLQYGTDYMYFTTDEGGYVEVQQDGTNVRRAPYQTSKLIVVSSSTASAVGEDGVLLECYTSDWDFWWQEITNDTNPSIGVPYAAVNVPGVGTPNAAVLAEDGSVWLTVSGTWTKIHDAFWGEHDGYGSLQFHQISGTRFVVVYSEDGKEAHAYNISSGEWKVFPPGDVAAFMYVAGVEDGVLTLKGLVNPASWEWAVLASASVGGGTAIAIAVGTAAGRPYAEPYVYMHEALTNCYVYRQGVLLPCKTSGYAPYANLQSAINITSVDGVLTQTGGRIGGQVFRSRA